MGMIRQRHNGSHYQVNTDKNEDSSDESSCAALHNVEVHGSRPLGAKPPDEHGRR